MNTAIILAGGVGSRMGLDCPKQFLMVQDKPIISYC
ncbi:MAG: NTP transferase domain-containing protein, partial [Ruminococcus sp.]|nr:NTP transferase domain-containing protein [Ruminococcus sp.]